MSVRRSAGGESDNSTFAKRGEQRRRSDCLGASRRDLPEQVDHAAAEKPNACGQPLALWLARLADLGQAAPALIQCFKMVICGSVSLLLGGIFKSPTCSTAAMRALFSGWPGTIAAPVTPPASSDSCVQRQISLLLIDTVAFLAVDQQGSHFAPRNIRQPPLLVPPRKRGPTPSGRRIPESASQSPPRGSEMA